MSNIHRVSDLNAWSTSDQGYVVTDTTGVILWVNDAMCDYLGYAQSELQDENIRVMMPPPYSLQHNHFMKKYARSMTYAYRALHGITCMRAPVRVYAVCICMHTASCA